MAKHEGWMHICFNSDAKIVMQSLNSKPYYALHLYAVRVFKDILNIYYAFSDVSFCWSNINCNKLAHTLCTWTAVK